MSDSTVPVLDSEVKEFLDLWAASFAQVLGTIRGQPSAVEVRLDSPPKFAPDPATDVHILLLPGGALRGEMNIRLPRPCALRLGQTLMSEATDETKELTPQVREACEELLRQVAGQTATALKPKWGDVQLTAQGGQAPSWTPAASAYLQETTGNSVKCLCEFQLSAAAVASLRMAQSSAEPGPEAAGNLELLMDVELKLALRFGSRRMLLQEILDLGTGAVVELDRRVQEPVELLLDGKLVARGEVVVVDGNYGLRVTEMALAKAA